jgi:signal transduction histidine kinase
MHPSVLIAAAFFAVAGVAALAWWAGQLVERGRTTGLLREARMQAQMLAHLLDVWHWQTDREHRLTRLQPPQGAPASAWGEGSATQFLWERFGGGELRERLAAQAPLQDLRVQQVQAAEPSTPWSLRGLPRFDGQGHFAGYVGTARVLEDDAALAAAAANARADEPAEDESFSYAVSHDLRAPLRVVDGFTRILKEDYGRVLDRVGNDHLDRVLGAAARMNSMIDALLALAQLSARPLARQPVNLSQLAGFIVDDLKRQSPERRVQVSIQPALMAQGDPTLLRVALENLLGNAWKYSSKSEHAQIVFEHGAHDGREVFTVRDNGAGFDMRFADRLFGVFQRLHSASDFQGTGVGLASVKRIVRRHGGEIWAEGEVGRGAKFYFTLPARSSE